MESTTLPTLASYYIIAQTLLPQSLLLHLPDFLICECGGEHFKQDILPTSYYILPQMRQTHVFSTTLLWYQGWELVQLLN